MLNVKNGPHLAYISVLTFFGFQLVVAFLRFPEYFPVITSGFTIISQVLS